MLNLRCARSHTPINALAALNHLENREHTTRAEGDTSDKLLLAMGKHKTWSQPKDGQNTGSLSNDVSQHHKDDHLHAPECSFRYIYLCSFEQGHKRTSTFSNTSAEKPPVTVTPSRNPVTQPARYLGSEAKQAAGRQMSAPHAPRAEKATHESSYPERELLSCNKRPGNNI